MLTKNLEEKFKQLGYEQYCNSDLCIGYRKIVHEYLNQDYVYTIDFCKHILGKWNVEFYKQLLDTNYFTCNNKLSLLVNKNLLQLCLEKLKEIDKKGIL